MRVVRTFVQGPMRVSFFSWNEKYMVKLEYGPYEQWFKFSQEQYPLERLEKLLDTEFYREAESRFLAMNDSLRNASLRSAEVK